MVQLNCSPSAFTLVKRHVLLPAFFVYNPHRDSWTTWPSDISMCIIQLLPIFSLHARLKSYSVFHSLQLLHANLYHARAQRNDFELGERFSIEHLTMIRSITPIRLQSLDELSLTNIFSIVVPHQPKRATEKFRYLTTPQLWFSRYESSILQTSTSHTPSLRFDLYGDKCIFSCTKHT